jgi:hypothetical protein
VLFEVFIVNVLKTTSFLDKLSNKDENQAVLLALNSFFVLHLQRLKGVL